MSTDNEPAEFQIDDTYSVPVCILSFSNFQYLLIYINF